MGTLSHGGGWAQFSRGDPGVTGHCRWCGVKLPTEAPGEEPLGYRSNGIFCSLRCGFQWACRQFGVRYPG